MKTEAAIIGAGPTGLIAARELAHGGVATTVYEEHNTIGEPNHCAGILSIEGLKRLGVNPNPDFKQQEIIGGTLYSPSGIGIRITSNRPRAYVVDRSQFDRHLAEIAQDKGVEIRTDYRVRNQHEIESSLIIDAEGVKATIAEERGFSRPKGIISGINVEVSGVELEEGMVEVWFGDKYSPGFFVWVTPTGDGTARCGLGCNRGDPWMRLRGFLDERFTSYDAGTPARWPILTGGPIERTHGDSILLVGDVAGQVKATTGGGVIMGGLCAIEAAETASKALEAGDTSMEYLKHYEDSWRAKYEQEFTTMLHARNIANRLSDARMNRLFDAAKKAGLEETAEKLINEGDMDMQSKIIRKALTNPSFIRVGVSAFGWVLLNEFLSILG